MKKLSFMILFTLSLIACGSNSGSGTSDTSEAITTATVTSKQLSVVKQIPADYARSVEVDDVNQILYLGDNSDLKIFDRSTNDSLLTAINSSGSDILDLALSQNKSYLYLVDYESFLIYDVSDKNNISPIDSIPSRGSDSLFITADEKTAVVKDLDGVKLVDISNKSDIQIVYEFMHTEHFISSIALSKNKKYLYTIESSSAVSEDYTFNIYDINTPSNPLLIDSENDFIPISMVVSNDETKLFLAGYGVLQIADISDIYNIKSLFEYELDIGSKYISLSDDDNTIALSGSGLSILNIKDLNDIKITKVTNTFWDLGRTKILDGLLYVPDGSNGLWIFTQ